MLLDFLKPLDHLAFKNKGIKTKRLVKAYADDLTLTTSLPEHNQLALDRMCTWLDWTVTMKAKPKKCYHLAMRIFDKRWPHKKFTQYHDELTYSPYDAHLTIKGQRVHFIANPQTEDPFKAKHFKFLGRNMHVDLSEQDVVEKVGRDLRQRLALVDKDPVFGLAKLWIYQFYILSFLAWPFLIHDFAISHVKALQPPTNKLLRRWAGLYKSADESILYRSREQFGLQLTSLTTHFKRMQVIKSHTLKHSNDPDVVDHYEQRALREKDISVWKGSQLLEVCEAMANHDFKFKGQNDRRGLGNGVYDPDPSWADHRKACGQAILKLESERYRGKVGCFERQGVWLQWSALAQPFDLSWKNLLWGRHDTPLFKFVLNATLNTVVTPTLRKLWNYVRRADCALCGHRKCTLHHIICNCKVALKQKRYTWRHDSVLNTLQPFLQELVEAANARPASKPEESKYPPLSDSFRPKGAAGGVKTVSKPRPKTKDGILYGARDWKLRIDLHKDKKNFPADICPTGLRPDIVIYSPSEKIVVLGELTAGAEEGIAKAHKRKDKRYANLLVRIKKNDWHPHLFSFEVGARGFVAHSTTTYLRNLGLSRRKSLTICRLMSRTAARCTYDIYQQAASAAWDPSRDLLLDVPLSEDRK